MDGFGNRGDAFGGDDIDFGSRDFVGFSFEAFGQVFEGGNKGLGLGAQFVYQEECVFFDLNVVHLLFIQT